MGLEWGWLGDPTGMPEWIAALLMILVAIGVFAIKPRHRWHQAFALFFATRGLVMLAATGSGLATGDTARFWTMFLMYPQSVLFCSLLWFMSVYPERRGIFGKTWWGPWILVAVGASLALLHAINPTLVASDLSNYSTLLATGTVYAHVLSIAGSLALGTAVLLFALDYARSEAGRRCRSLYFVMLAFAVHATYDTGSFWLGVNTNVGETSAWSLAAFVPETLLLLGACGVLVFGFERRSDLHRRRDLVGFFAVVLLSLTASAVTSGLGNKALVLTNAGFSRLLTAGLVAYALLSRQLLEIDLVLKWTIKRGAVVAILLASFFIVSQVAQTFLSGTVPGVAGAVVVGLMLFAIAPLQRFAERLSEKAVPNAKPVAELGKDERAAIYLDLARSAWSDGTINRSERTMLNELQKRLGLTDAAAKRLEDQAAVS